MGILALGLLLSPLSTSSSSVNTPSIPVIDNIYLTGNASVFISNTERLVWEKAHKYCLNFQFFTALIECECDKDKHEKCVGDGGLAFGRAQFHLNTFNENCDGSYYSEEDQLECAAKMISKGMGNRWTCYTKIMRKKG